MANQRVPDGHGEGPSMPTELKLLTAVLLLGVLGLIGKVLGLF